MIWIFKNNIGLNIRQINGLECLRLICKLANSFNIYSKLGKAYGTL